MTVHRQSNSPIASMRVPLAAIALVAALAVSYALGATFSGGGTTSHNSVSVPSVKVAQGVGTISQEEFVASAFIAHESAMEATFGSLASLRQPAPFELAFARSQHDVLIDATLGLDRASTASAIPAFDIGFARAQHDALIDAALGLDRVSVELTTSFNLAFARSQHDALIDALALS